MEIEPIARMNYQNVPQMASKPEITEQRKAQEKEAPTSISINDAIASSKENRPKAEIKSAMDAKKSPTESEKQIRDAISQVNNKLMNRTKCEFSYHEETKRVSIKVIDEDTKEVIREIPPEETLDMVQRVWELAGLLVDEKR